MKKENDLISIALWAANRLHNKQQQKYVYEELLRNIGDEHEYADFVKRELDMIVLGYDSKAYRKVAHEYCRKVGDWKWKLKMSWVFIYYLLVS